jgi:predicted metal-dependent hydrolase
MEVSVMFNEDLLAALQELLEASSAMTSGQLPTASQLERYQRAREWAQRLLDRDAKAKNSRLTP